IAHAKFAASVTCNLRVKPAAPYLDLEFAIPFETFSPESFSIDDVSNNVGVVTALWQRLRFDQPGFAMTWYEDTKPVIAAAGMDFEARMAHGPGVVVVYGQNRAAYLQDLHRRIKLGARGMISFGIAGGICPDLNPGDVVVAKAVMTAGAT